MTASDTQVVRRAWDAFAGGDVDAAVAALDPEVHWYAAGELDAEDSCHNRDEAAAFVRRALAEGVTAELLDVRDAGDRLVAIIRTHAPAGWEQGPEPHGELVTVRDGRITEMVVYPTVDDALVAAGLPAGS